MWPYCWKYDILRHHSRYDFGNSCASKRRELQNPPIGQEKKERMAENKQENVPKLKRFGYGFTSTSVNNKINNCLLTRHVSLLFAAGFPVLSLGRSWTAPVFLCVCLCVCVCVCVTPTGNVFADRLAQIIHSEVNSLDDTEWPTGSSELSVQPCKNGCPL